MRKSKSNEFTRFNDAMGTILRADPKAVKEAMEAEKRANAQKRQQKEKAQNDNQNS